MIAFVLLLLLGGSGDVVESERAFAAGHYAEAEAGYAAALAQGEGSAADLLFNLGNCHFRQGDFAHAAWCYRRSLLRDPGDRETRFNLGLAEERLGIEGPRPGLRRTLAFELRERWGLDPILLVLAVGQALGVLVVFRARRRLRLRLVAGLLLLVSVVGLGLVVSTILIPDAAQVVVLDGDTQLRSSPTATSSPGDVVPPGTVLRRHEDGAGFVRVTGQVDGWLGRERLGFVD